MSVVKPTHTVTVDHDNFDCAVVLKVWTPNGAEVTSEIRVAVEDIPEFLRDVGNHVASALSTAARRIEVGHCETCANTGLVNTTKNGNPWSVHCPDCRHKWPSKPFANAPHIGRRDA